MGTVGQHGQARGQAGDDRGLAGIAPLVARPEPVPAEHGVIATGLARIDDQQPVLLGKGVHARPGGEVLRALRAAMQHHDQPLQPFVSGRRHIEPVAARAGRAGIVLIEEPGAFGQRQLGGVRRPAEARQSVQLEPLSACLQGADDLAQRLAQPFGV